MATTLPIQQVEERTPNDTREPPAWIVREIQKVGGMVSDSRGRRPRFRVIWGGSRWTVGADGRTLIRPYRVDMWHLEKLHEGEYEHCHRLGECPVQGGHRKTGKDTWCRACFFNGGVPLPIESSLGFIETCIRLIQKTEEMQKRAVHSAAERTAQKDALVGREEKIEAGKGVEIREAMADAMPKTVKRSFETPLRLSAQEALGTQKGIRQLNAREIVRGMRKKRGGK
jgi:hypothetical protein